MELNTAIETIFEQSSNIIDGDFLTKDQKTRLENLELKFEDEFLGNQRTLMMPFDSMIKNKTIELLFERLQILKEKDIMSSIWKSIRVCKIDEKEIIVVFIYLTEKCKDFDNNFLNEIIHDDGKEIDPNDQDWI